MHGAQPLAPPELAARGGLRLGEGANPSFVEHHVHVLGIPERGEDPARDAKGWAAVVILLVRLRKGEGDGASPIVQSAHAGQVSQGESGA